MRLFIAIPVAPAVRDRLADIQARLIETRASVRWVDPSLFHLTVKFLGETDEAFLPEISARLSRAADQTQVFSLEMEGLGHFPEKGNPRVIVAHAYSPDHRLTRLHRLIDSGLGGIGLPMDTRELSAHLTLGRVESNAGLNKLLRLLAKHETDFFGSFEVAEAALFKSTLTPEGPVYQRLHVAPLHQSVPTNPL